MSIFCEDCEYLFPTEGQQQMAKYRLSDHTCKKFNRVVKHNGYHPLLPRVVECLSLGRSLVQKYGEKTSENIQKLRLF